MKTFLCVCLVIVSFLSYVFLSPMLSFYQYHPIIHYLGMAAGIICLILLMIKDFTKLRLVATIVSVLLVCFTFWYTMSFSQYSDTEATITSGDISDEQLKLISLVSSTGEELNLGEVFQNNRGTLIVFNRGEW